MLDILYYLGTIGVFFTILFFLLLTYTGEIDGGFFFWFPLLCICIVISVIGISAYNSIDDSFYEDVVKTGEWELIPFSQNGELSVTDSDSLFYVNVLDEVYSFFYIANNDGIQKSTVDIDVTTIYETDDCTPHVVEYTTYIKNKMDKLTFQNLESSYKTYEIYIPTGTIFITFSLDSQQVF